MKTILKKKRRLIVRFFKAFVIIVTLFCILYVAKFMYDLLGFEEIEYEDASHVLEIFEENKSDFDAMVDVLQRTNINRIIFDDYMDTPRKFDACPGDALKNPKYQLRRRGFLKGKDYKAICRFFKKYGPCSIEGTFQFCFAFQTKDDVVQLFYIPHESKDKILNYYSFHYTMNHLTDEWYFGTLDVE